MNFDFVSAGHIVFGPGRVREIGGIARSYGARCLLVRGGSAAADHVRESLWATGSDVTELRGPRGEPDETDVDAGVPAARKARPAVVVAVGGGSVIDYAKAIAALVPQTELSPVRDYLEGVGRGRTIDLTPIPLIACPTTAGTGAEVTKNAVISSRAGRFKKSLRDARMVPAVALVDPETQAGAPRDVRVWSGLDALTQNVEAYLSRRAGPMTQPLALRGLRAAHAGLSCLAHDYAERAQEPLALSALLSGLALANGGLGAAHGIAQSLGIWGVPHGLACAVALPWVVAANARHPGVAARLGPLYESLSPNAGYNEYGELQRGVLRSVLDLVRPFRLPRLSELGDLYPDLPALDGEGIALLARGSLGNSLSGNPVEMGAAEVAELLEQMRDLDGPEALLA